MKTYIFDHALLPNGWASYVAVNVDESTGLITSIQDEVKITELSRAKHYPAIAIPAFTNGHSHAFQRAFAGLSEYRTQQQDSFWTWRKLMYDFVQTLTPETLYPIAKNLYRNMVRAGYAIVCEFHYVHHDEQGTAYPELDCMANVLVQAALDAGISICIIPVLYQRGGFFGQALEYSQSRFYNSVETYCELLNRLQTNWASNTNVSVGIAFHSLRAVEVNVMKDVLQDFKPSQASDNSIPIHIHIAEQTAEVDDCLKATGSRPIDYLLENFDVDLNWCLVHATHLSEREIRDIAKSGATVCVCPSTEANLGDGIFPAEEYLLKHGGRLAVGSDSNLCINPFAELRMLEYSQRLTKQRRAILSTPEMSTGRFLADRVWLSGSAVSNLATGSIEPGKRLDVALLDPEQFQQSHFSAQRDRCLDYCLVNETSQNVESCIIGMLVNGVEQMF
ncbi:MAG TPA: formimidoylglutamate deiminase [Pirellulaceae bacterium]|nr:formimidoylglutamate deiminase [Pirellulaceae bacterium]HMO91396.1 formimidoylglutamate deiminase [Pirellulaceae bacterium]HMP69621.1 formimidoylglutamate deiminase [Pirellulaceae bacterium]